MNRSAASQANAIDSSLPVVRYRHPPAPTLSNVLRRAAANRLERAGNGIAAAEF